MGETHRQQFQRIFCQYGGPLARAIHSYARTAADEKDLAQEVALALWNALPAFRGDCPERAFVLRIAHNRGLSFLWRRRDFDPIPDGIQDPAPPVDVQVQQRERITNLYEGIRELNPVFRQVLTLALEGLGHAEIGAALGISEGNVAVRLSRARAALREILLPEVKDE